MNILEDRSRVFWHVYFHNSQHLYFSLLSSLEGMSGKLLKGERSGSLVVYYYRHSFPELPHSYCENSYGHSRSRLNVMFWPMHVIAYANLKLVWKYSSFPLSVDIQGSCTIISFLEVKYLTCRCAKKLETGMWIFSNL